MQCPTCTQPTLKQSALPQGAMVDLCTKCHGLWLDCGEILDFSDDPEHLEAQLEKGLRGRHVSDHLCPRCHRPMDEGTLPDREVRAEQCPDCRGLWFTADEVANVGGGGLSIPTTEKIAESDPMARAEAEERLHGLSSGMLALPNLFVRSFLTLVVLYALLTLVLISVSLAGYLPAGLAVVIGVVFAIVQFTLGPWIMDLCLTWLYKFKWQHPDDLPEHLREFVERVCAENKMRFPSFGLINDGAPAAFTYGHHPGNARVVISRGILELLEPAEVEAVVAHELGHARNWDMALMTIANLVPLLMYYLYRVSTSRDGKNNTWYVSVGAYVIYIVSEYLVLWFSRTREYYADRFSGQATGNPNALVTALVKIAYGLAASVPPEKAEGDANDKDKKKKKKQKSSGSTMDALGALNIFDKKAAAALVMASASGTEHGPSGLDIERVKGAMQWDLWNPWAKFYELHSTHPLVAKRLLYLTDQAAHQGQEPLIVFDRRKPESYWDDFFVDVAVMALPMLTFLACLAAFIALGIGAGSWLFGILAAGVGLAGMASLYKTHFAYRRDFFPHLSVAALLHRVKVSEVRPVPVTLTGTIIGKGVPGLIWSEDFVLRDRTGIIFIDYRQPLAIWNFLFGLFRANKYQDKEVLVTGWFRRAPVPYLELNRLEVIDDSLPARNCYTRFARVFFASAVAIVGIAAAAVLFAVQLAGR